jgi:hypothetical protein
MSRACAAAEQRGGAMRLSGRGNRESERNLVFWVMPRIAVGVKIDIFRGNLPKRNRAVACYLSANGSGLSNNTSL